MRLFSSLPAFVFLVAAMTSAATLIGCNAGSSPPADLQPKPTEATSTNPKDSHATSPSEEHGHKPGSHGGIIVSLGRDSYHVEAIVEKSGALRLYMLGKDESRVIDIEAQDLIAYVKPSGDADSLQITLKPAPQPGDQQAKASLFVGQLPADAIGKQVDITIPNITIAGERFRIGFSTQHEQHAEEAKPEAAEGAKARELYLSPGGIYTAADIIANGNMTAGEKFKGIVASHDLTPKPGDKICPITLTKANPKFSWIIGGKTYDFCCPPCVDEFVALAKTDPERIQDPTAYVKGETQASP